MCLSAAYKRVLLKLSGEVLAGENKMGFDFSVVNKVCQTVKRCADMGVQVAIVIGGGNFWRGRSSGDMDRTRADHMGMLATVINSLALCDELEKLGTKAKVLSAISMPQIADLYTKRDAVAALENGEVVIFGCGTGSPFFSTDTTAAYRAGCDRSTRRRLCCDFWRWIGNSFLFYRYCGGFTCGRNRCRYNI